MRWERFCWSLISLQRRTVELILNFMWTSSIYRGRYICVKKRALIYMCRTLNLYNEQYRHTCGRQYICMINNINMHLEDKICMINETDIHMMRNIWIVGNICPHAVLFFFFFSSSSSSSFFFTAVNFLNWQIRLQSHRWGRFISWSTAQDKTRYEGVKPTIGFLSFYLFINIL